MKSTSLSLFLSLSLSPSPSLSLPSFSPTTSSLPFWPSLLSFISPSLPPSLPPSPLFFFFSSLYNHITLSFLLLLLLLYPVDSTDVWSFQVFSLSLINKMHTVVRSIASYSLLCRVFCWYLLCQGNGNCSSVIYYLVSVEDSVYSKQYITYLSLSLSLFCSICFSLCLCLCLCLSLSLTPSLFLSSSWIYSSRYSVATWGIPKTREKKLLSPSLSTTSKKLYK